MSASRWNEARSSAFSARTARARPRRCACSPGTFRRPAARALVAGYDVFDQPLEAKRRTGYLPETPPLYPDMTVREYLTFVAKIKGVPPKERKARVEQVMRKTYVSDMAEPRLRQALEGLSPARRPRAGAHPQSRRPDSRRAHRRPRPEADHRDAPAGEGACRQPHDRAEHAHPPGGGADLPARRDHQQGQGRRRRYARQPHRSAPRIGSLARAGGRRPGAR